MTAYPDRFDDEEDEDLNFFHNPDFRYERTHGDRRAKRDIPIKDARFAPGNSDYDQRRSRILRNVLDNVDEGLYDEDRYWMNREHAEMGNAKLRRWLDTQKPYEYDDDGEETPSFGRFHPNSNRTRNKLEMELVLREIESKPTSFYNENPFSEEFQDIHMSEDSSFDQAWNIAKREYGGGDPDWNPLGPDRPEDEDWKSQAIDPEYGPLADENILNLSHMRDLLIDLEARRSNCLDNHGERLAVAQHLLEQWWVKGPLFGAFDTQAQQRQNT